MRASSKRVDGREDMYPQSGDPCDVTIESAMFEKTSDEHDEAAFVIYKAIKDAETHLDPLGDFNQVCQEHLVRPLSQLEFEEFLRNQQERDETNNENYKTRVLSLYKSSPHLFSNVTTSAAGDTTADDADDDSKRSFRGHCVDCIDSAIPRGYRTMMITHPKVKGTSGAKATLPYARFNDNESLAVYVERVGEGGLVKIGIKMTPSHKTIKAQSCAINALKCPRTAKPRPPLSQSQQAYRYTLRFDPREASQVDLIKEFPGIANVIDKKAAPAFIQSIFDELPSTKQACLTDLRESIARLHFIAGVAGSGKSYLMEVLMLFAVFGNGLDNPHKLKILYIMNSNVGITTFCKRLSQTFRK
jgi:hypothetical protein